MLAACFWSVECSGYSSSKPPASLPLKQEGVTMFFQKACCGLLSLCLLSLEVVLNFQHRAVRQPHLQNMQVLFIEKLRTWVHLYASKVWSLLKTTLLFLRNVFVNSLKVKVEAHHRATLQKPLRRKVWHRTDFSDPYMEGVYINACNRNCCLW